MKPKDSNDGTRPRICRCGGSGEEDKGDQRTEDTLPTPLDLDDASGQHQCRKSREQ